MMAPDRLAVVQVKLAAAGFHRNSILAKKFVLVYQQCENQLSKQTQYDFGLRNIIVVVSALRQARLDNPTTNEDEIFFRVVRDINISKLVSEDVPLFLALMGDVFPGKEVQVRDRHAHTHLSATLCARAHNTYTSRTRTARRSCRI